MSTSATEMNDAGMIELTGIEESSEEEILAPVPTFDCAICNFSTRYKSSLKRHMKVHYDEPDENAAVPGNVCHVCGAQLKTKYGLKQHVDSKHKLVFRFKCGQCEKGFNSLYNYRGHLAAHDKVLRERCTQCPATFQYKTGLQDHMRGIHGDSDYSCTVKDCDKKFSSSRALLEHSLVVHQDRRYNCSMCNKSYKWRSCKLYHERNAHKLH